MCGPRPARRDTFYICELCDFVICVPKCGLSNVFYAGKSVLPYFISRLISLFLNLCLINYDVYITLTNIFFFSKLFSKKKNICLIKYVKNVNLINVLYNYYYLDIFNHWEIWTYIYCAWRLQLYNLFQSVASASLYRVYLYFFYN